MEFKNESKTINSGKEGKYKKYFMELKFNSDDNLPLNEILKFHMLTIVVRSVYEKDGKFYPQIFWMRVCMSYKCQNMTEQIFQKEFKLTKQMHQKSVIFVTIGTF